MRFYTSVDVHWDTILERGYEDGKRFSRRVRYHPYLFVTSQADNPVYKTIKNEPVDKVIFQSMKEARGFINKYKDVTNFTFYGMNQWEYPYINDAYPGKVEYDPELITVLNLDIEVDSSGGFERPQTARREVTAISLRCRDLILVFGCQPYSTKQENVYYIQCENERELLLRFLSYWRELDADVLTGWNINRYDIPYLINRIKLVLGEDFSKKLSPWGMIKSKTVRLKFNNQIEEEVYDIIGLAILDYIDLYKKFSTKKQESEALDYIGYVELKMKKLDYSEYDNLNQLFKENYQKFIDYNIRDTEIVHLLNKKLKFLELSYALAYDSKINLQDVYGSVRLWDVIIHNYLMDRNTVVPFKTHTEKTRKNEGAYVKPVQVGLHKWVVSYDLRSEYPFIIVQNNIGPETLDILIPNQTPDTILNGSLDAHRRTIQNKNLTVSGSGQTFTKEVQSFLSILTEEKYQGRDRYKILMQDTEKEMVRETEPTKKRTLENLVAQYNAYQHSLKIVLNSLYGASSNEFFRWFDLRLAEAITLTGQTATHWVIRDINKYLNKLCGTTDVDFVIAADTDSCYIDLERLVKKYFKTNDEEKIINMIDKFCKDKLSGIIADSFQKFFEYTNGYKPGLFMKRELLCSSGVWLAKKCYVLNVWDSEGTRFAEPEVRTKGIKTNRSDTPEVSRTALKSAIKIILNKTQEELITFVKTFHNEFIELPIEDIAEPRGISDMNKYMDKTDIYKSKCPAHVKAAIFYNSQIQKLNLLDKYPLLVNNSRMKFVWLKDPNPIHDTVIGFANRFPPQFNLEDYVDREHMFQKTFIKPLEVITDLIGWVTKPVSTLEDAFE